MVPPRRLRWLPVNLGSAADLGGLLTLVTQKWVVGLAAYSDSEPRVTFVVLVDGEDRGSTVLRVGQLQLVNIDVSGGSRLELYVATDSVTCEGRAIAAWVDPMVTQ